VAWFDTEAEYYQAPEGPLRQGDIVLAATVVVGAGVGPEPGVAPAQLGQARTVKLWTALGHTLPEAPSLQAQVRWDLAMVLPHDCALEKEFNERVVELLAQGQDEADAVRAASADPALDRYLAVAPIRDYSVLPERRREGARGGQRHGAFPVPASALYALESGWVDLNAPTTVDRVSFSPSLRVASLTDRAVDYLRASLARHWAYRDLTRADEISRALGRTIVDIHAAPMGKDKLRLELHLDGDAGTITLEGSNKPKPANRTPTRKM
jgi:hypothetical protein